MPREDFVPSNITEFVIDKISSHDALNAPTKEEGDKVFDDILLRNLPELSGMEWVYPPRLGANTDVYSISYNGHTFYIKEKINISDKAFNRVQQEHARACQYFEPYIPLTRFITRFSQEKQVNEHLIIQDIGDGLQFKAFWKYRDNISMDIETKNIRESPHFDSIKLQLEDIVVRMTTMIIETGYVIDLDFFIDPNTGIVMIFDTDNHMFLQADGVKAFLTKVATRLHSCFAIKTPTELDNIISELEDD